MPRSQLLTPALGPVGGRQLRACPTSADRPQGECLGGWPGLVPGVQGQWAAPTSSWARRPLDPGLKRPWVRPGSAVGPACVGHWRRLPVRNWAFGMLGAPCSRVLGDRLGTQGGHCTPPNPTPTEAERPAGQASPLPARRPSHPKGASPRCLALSLGCAAHLLRERRQH